MAHRLSCFHFLFSFCFAAQSLRSRDREGNEPREPVKGREGSESGGAKGFRTLEGSAEVVLKSEDPFHHGDDGPGRVVRLFPALGRSQSFGGD